MGVNVITDYGATALLNTYFEAAASNDLRLILLTAHGLGATQSTAPDTPTIVEYTVGNGGYARKFLRNDCGALEYQTTAGVTSTVGATGIPAYKYLWARNDAGIVEVTSNIIWTFTSIPNPIVPIVGYAICEAVATTPKTAAITSAMALYVQAFDNAFTPGGIGDTLTLESISIRLTKFNGSGTFI